MASSLYNSSKNARKVFIVILIIALVYIGIDTYGKLVKSTQIVAPAHFSFYKDPDYLLGSIGIIGTPKIAAISFSGNPTYSLSNPFNSFPDVAYIYKIDKPRELLTTIDDAQKTAQLLGFTTIADQQGDDFTWTAAATTKTLKFNKSNGVWSLRTKYNDNIEAKKNKNLFSDDTQYDSSVSGVISSLGFENSYGLTDGAINTSFADIQSDGTLFKPDNSRNSKYVVANIFRNIDYSELRTGIDLSGIKDKSLVPTAPPKVKVYKSDAKKGEFRLVVSNDLSSYARDIFEWDFINFAYSFKDGVIQRGLYPIITPEEGWNLVQNKKGFLTQITPEDGNTLLSYSNLGLTQVVADGFKTEFGYFEPDEWTGYIYPIFIYTGRAQLSNGKQASFKIYVDAIKKF